MSKPRSILVPTSGGLSLWEMPGAPETMATAGCRKAIHGRCYWQCWQPKLLRIAAVSIPPAYIAVAPPSNYPTTQTEAESSWPLEDDRVSYPNFGAAPAVGAATIRMSKPGYRRRLDCGGDGIGRYAAGMGLFKLCAPKLAWLQANGNGVQLAAHKCPDRLGHRQIPMIYLLYTDCFTMIRQPTVSTRVHSN